MEGRPIFIGVIFWGCQFHGCLYSDVHYIRGGGYIFGKVALHLVGGYILFGGWGLYLGLRFVGAYILGCL